MSIAISGGLNVYFTFSGETRVFFIDGMAEALLLAGWTMRLRLKPTVTITLGANVTNNQQVIADGITYTWKNTINNANPNEVLRGSGAADSYANLVAAINQDTGAGTKYSSSTGLHPTVYGSTDALTFTFTAKKGGPYKNGLVTTYGTLKGGGYRISTESPQHLPVVLDVYDRQLTDSFGNQFVHVKMISDIDPIITTREHTLRVMDEELHTTGVHAWGPSIGSEVDIADGVSAAQNGHWWLKRSADDTLHIYRKYTVIANRCQFFIFPHGVDHDSFGSIICGGVPYVKLATPLSPVTCHGEVSGAEITECFWLSGDFTGGVGNPHCTLRTAIVRAGHVYDADVDHQGTGNLNDVGVWGGSDTVLNGIALNGGTDGAHQALQFGPVSMTPTNDFDFLIATGAGEALVSSIKWCGDQPFELESLIGWSPDGVLSPVLIGQIWDAFYRTEQVPMDRIETKDDAEKSEWYAFTNKSKFGTLWLRILNRPRLQAHYVH